MSFQFVENGNTTYLYIADIDNHRILKFDVSTKELDYLIDVQALEQDRYSVFNFSVLHPDTILIERDISNLRQYNDDALFFINQNGKTIKSVELDSNDFYLKNTFESPYKVSLKHKFRPLSLSDNRLFFNPTPHYGTVTNKEIDENNIPIIGYFNFKQNQTAYRHTSFKNPQLLNGNFSNKQETLNLLVLNKKEVIVSYNNNLNLFKYTIGNENVLKSNGVPNLITAPTPLHDSIERNQTNQFSSRFDMLTKGPDNTVLRFGFFGITCQNKLNNRTYFNLINKQKWFGVYNAELKLKGEGIVPNSISTSWPKPELYKNEIYAKSKLKTNGLLRFYKISISPNSKNIDSLKREIDLNLCPKTPPKQLSDFGKLKLIPNNSTVLVIPEASCPACVNYSLNYYLTHFEKMKELDVYLITSNKMALKAIDSVASKYILIDEKDELSHFLSNEINNPTLIAWKNNQVTTTMVLPPNEVIKLEDYIDYFNKL